MAERKSAYIDIQALVPQVSLEQAADYYGITLPELKRIGQEIRTRCFLNCGRSDETGERALAIQDESATKIWKCFQYGCTKGGNLVGLCDLMKPGDNAGGRPRGERFKEIARDLQTIVAGGSAGEGVVATTPAPKKPSAVPSVNIPLAAAENERARELVQLDEQFVIDPAEMPPEAAGYFRHRPFLTPENCQRYRLGYLPRSSKSLLRGKIVYPYFSASGQLLTWFGRDPLYDEKHRRWLASDRSGLEPVKTQFVKGFQRGRELWGEHLLRVAGSFPIQPRVGLVIVEGPNDAINLQTLGVPAVALCSHTITNEQVERIALLARDISNERVTLMLDCDPAGETGVAQVLPLLVEHAHVRVPWRRGSHAGKFRDRQPESLVAAELEELFSVVQEP
jgi:5S rRNA maturation endonuclease (ribonuclease M5)